MSQAPQNESKKRSPRYLRSNGRVREDHASASMLFWICYEEGEIREYQIKSFDAGSGNSVFRCVICGSLLELNKKQVDEIRASGK